jgi:hypothetical protein
VQESKCARARGYDGSRAQGQGARGGKRGQEGARGGKRGQEGARRGKICQARARRSTRGQIRAIEGKQERTREGKAWVWRVRLGVFTSSAVESGHRPGQRALVAGQLTLTASSV